MASSTTGSDSALGANTVVREVAPEGGQKAAETTLDTQNVILSENTISSKDDNDNKSPDDGKQATSLDAEATTTKVKSNESVDDGNNNKIAVDKPSDTGSNSTPKSNDANTIQDTTKENANEPKEISIENTTTVAAIQEEIIKETIEVAEPMVIEKEEIVKETIEVVEPMVIEKEIIAKKPIKKVELTAAERMIAAGVIEREELPFKRHPIKIVINEDVFPEEIITEEKKEETTSALQTAIEKLTDPRAAINSTLTSAFPFTNYTIERIDFFARIDTQTAERFLASYSEIIFPEPFTIIELHIGKRQFPYADLFCVRIAGKPTTRAAVATSLQFFEKKSDAITFYEDIKRLCELQRAPWKAVEFPNAEDPASVVSGVSPVVGTYLAMALWDAASDKAQADYRASSKLYLEIQSFAQIEHMALLREDNDEWSDDLQTQILENIQAEERLLQQINSTLESNVRDNALYKRILTPKIFLFALRHAVTVPLVQTGDAMGVDFQVQPQLGASDGGAIESKERGGAVRDVIVDLRGESLRAEWRKVCATVIERASNSKNSDLILQTLFAFSTKHDLWHHIMQPFLMFATPDSQPAIEKQIPKAAAQVTAPTDENESENEAADEETFDEVKEEEPKNGDRETVGDEGKTGEEAKDGDGVKTGEEGKDETKDGEGKDEATKECPSNQGDAEEAEEEKETVSVPIFAPKYGHGLMQRMASMEWVLAILKTNGEAGVNFLLRRKDVTEGEKLDSAFSAAEEHVKRVSPFSYYGLKSYCNDVEAAGGAKASLLSCAFQSFFLFPRSNILSLLVAEMLTCLGNLHDDLCKQILQEAIVDMGWMTELLKTIQKSSLEAQHRGFCIRILNWMDGESRLLLPQPVFVSPYEVRTVDVAAARREDERVEWWERQCGSKTKRLLLELLQANDSGKAVIAEWTKVKGTLARLNKVQDTPICPIAKTTSGWPGMM